MYPKPWLTVGGVRAKLAAHRLLILALLVATLGTGALGYIGIRASRAGASQSPGLRLVYDLTLPDGRRALVYNNGLAQIYSKDRRDVMYQRFPVAAGYDQMVAGAGLPDKTHLIWDLMQGSKQPYREGVVVVVFRSDVTATQDVLSVPTTTVLAMHEAKTATQRHALAPHYTTDADTNALLADLGVDRSERLLRTMSRQQLATMHASAEAAAGHALLDFSNAYRLHLVGATVATAVAALLRAPSVVYASPDWAVTGMSATPITLPQQVLADARKAQAATRTSARAGVAMSGSVPDNYALAASAQSLLNAPGVNAAEAFDAIETRWGQLPGQGITITNVSLGDLDDASALGSSSGTGGAGAAARSGTTGITPNGGGGGGGGGGGNANPCAGFVGFFGPTTEVVNGQRYLDWPSLPLIPTYTADAGGNLDGQGQVCGVDPFLGEVGLDFSVMAPLPEDQQRPGARGSGLTDLLGIAPGASYRLVVPASNTPTTSDVLAAFLGAANQSPRPDIITASLGFGEDAFGFPSRYLEEDPLIQALVTSIVHDDGIVVTISGGDGTRTFTNAAIGPSGGSAATEAIPPGGTPTNLGDVALSTAPSQVVDSGAIAVGGSTLDDISSAPPHDPANAALAAQHAYPETRWNGFTAFSSAFGSRLDLSAPSDNIIALEHSFGGDANAVDVVLDGGTSASAPEVAATAAVMLQVGKLIGKPFRTPQELRRFLQQTGRHVPNAPQADVDLRVGPQVDVGHAVETLLIEAGTPLAPSVPRVAVEQRRGLGDFNSNLDSFFTTDTDPANIDLQGPAAPTDGHPTGRNAKAWITLAPDWEGLPDGVSFVLTVAGHTGQVLATTRWARLLPEQILAAAGLPLAATAARTITLNYAAIQRSGTLVQTTFTLTFGPAEAMSEQALSPLVPPVVDATNPDATIPVRYDLTEVSGVTNPTLVVSEPGRVNPVTGFLFHPAYTAPLSARKGTIQVPVSALPGGGIYGIGIQLGSVDTGFGLSTPIYSDFAYTRVAVGTSARPAAPLLANSGAAAGHLLEIGYGASFQVSWDVTNVSGATGAMLEVGPGGPTPSNSYNVLDNPNGSVRDRNGVDTGSVAYIPLPGKKGVTTLSGLQAQLLPTLFHNVRILPTNENGAAGEASDVSTIRMDGVAPSGGFSLYALNFGANSAFGINRHGSDGLLPSIATTASGDTITSLETFDQTTNAITGTVAPPTGPTAFYVTPGAGVYGHDIGMYGVVDADPNSPTFGQTTFHTVNLLAGGSTTGTWTPPLQQQFELYLGAMNQETNDVAFLTQAQTPSGAFAWQVFASNIATNTSGPAYNLNDAVAGAGYQNPVFNGIGQNTSTNTAVLTGFDEPEALTTCSEPTMVTVGLASGQIGTFTGIGDGQPAGLVVNSRTNMAYVPMDPQPCGDQVTAPGLGIYDLTAKMGRLVSVPAYFTMGSSIDEEHGLIFDLTVTGNLFSLDNNQLNELLVMKEDGTVLNTIKRFDLWNLFLPIYAHLLQTNPTSRMGYTYGAFGQQVEPFSY